jgi:hypothetical protein
MKHTPTERKALDAAKNIAPMPAAEYVAIRKTPAAQRTVTQRRSIFEDDLKHAAEAFESRERTNDLYRHFLRKGDRSEARWHAPSPLVASTQSLRRDLVEAWKDLLEFERMPLAPRVTREPKRWRKSTRFFALLEVQRTIEKNGGKVRHRHRPTRKDILYARLIAPGNPQRGNRTPEPLQLALNV